MKKDISISTDGGNCIRRGDIRVLDSSVALGLGADGTEADIDELPIEARVILGLLSARICRHGILQKCSEPPSLGER